MSQDSFSEKIDRLIRWLLYGLVLFLPYSKSAVETSLILALILWFVKRAVLFQGDGSALSLSKISRHFSLPPGYLNPFIAIFLLTCLFSVAGGKMPLHSLDAFFTKILEWFIIYFLVLEVFREKTHFYHITIFMLITAGATAIDAILQYHVLGVDLFRGYELVEGHRATAGFIHSNSLGSFLAMMIPLALSCCAIFRRSILRKRAFCLLFLIFLMWAMVTTFSRGGWIAAVLAILLFAVFYNSSRIRKTAFFAFIFILTVAGFLLTASEDVKEEFRLTSENVYATVDWRWNVWEESMEMIQDRPVTGFGLNTYMTVFQKYRENRTGQPTYAHNCFIQMTVETGLLGLSAFLALLGAVIVRSGKYLYTLRSSIRHQPLMLIFLGLYSAVIGSIFHAAVETNFYSLQLSALFWVLAGLLTPLGKLVRQDSPKEGEL